MNSSMVVHGTNEELDTMAARFKVALRGGDKLANNEARALAQIAMVTGLDPYIGEIWYIPGKGPMIGIAGARRLWNEQSRKGDGFSFVDIQPCSPGEAGATETDVVAAFKAVAHDSKATREYTKMFQENINMLREAKAEDPFAIAREICGPKPQWVGYGYSTKSETSRMNKMQLARKRAEADALKKCIVVPFGVNLEVSTNERADDYYAENVIDGSVTNPQAEQSAEMTPLEARNTKIMVRGSEKLMGELTSEQLRYVMDNSLNAQNVEAARIVLKNDFSME